MKYDVEFWKKVLSKYENGDNCLICNCSYPFYRSWNRSIAFKINLQSIADNWPDKPKDSRVEGNYLFINDDFSSEEERKTRIDFLNYLITNKIEFEV